MHPQPLLTDISRLCAGWTTGYGGVVFSWAPHNVDRLFAKLEAATMDCQLQSGFTAIVRYQVEYAVFVDIGPGGCASGNRRLVNSRIMEALKKLPEAGIIAWVLLGQFRNGAGYWRGVHIFSVD